MNKEKQIDLIKATENYLIEKYGVSFLRLSKEKQSALICETLIKAIKKNTHGV